MPTFPEFRVFVIGYENYDEYTGRDYEKLVRAGPGELSGSAAVDDLLTDIQERAVTSGAVAAPCYAMFPAGPSYFVFAFFQPRTHVSSGTRVAVDMTCLYSRTSDLVQFVENRNFGTLVKSLDFNQARRVLEPVFRPQQACELNQSRVESFSRQMMTGAKELEIPAGDVPFAEFVEALERQSRIDLTRTVALGLTRARDVFPQGELISFRVKTPSVPLGSPKSERLIQELGLEVFQSVLRDRLANHYFDAKEISRRLRRITPEGLSDLKNEALIVSDLLEEEAREAVASGAIKTSSPFIELAAELKRIGFDEKLSTSKSGRKDIFSVPKRSYPTLAVIGATIAIVALMIFFSPLCQRNKEKASVKEASARPNPPSDRQAFKKAKEPEAQDHGERDAAEYKAWLSSVKYEVDPLGSDRFVITLSEPPPKDVELELRTVGKTTRLDPPLQFWTPDKTTGEFRLVRKSGPSTSDLRALGFTVSIQGSKLTGELPQVTNSQSSSKRASEKSGKKGK